jgi:hypothetical protein
MKDPDGMTTGEAVSMLIGALLGAFVVTVLIAFTGNLAGTLRGEAVRRGVARYHPQTGQWEWTVPEVNEASP